MFDDIDFPMSDETYMMTIFWCFIVILGSIMIFT